MILKNKLTKETLNISYSEFRKRFARKLQLAFESYRQTQLNKYSYKFKDNNSIEQDFYFDLQWNFNHFGNLKPCSKCDQNWFHLIFINYWLIYTLKKIKLRFRSFKKVFCNSIQVQVLKIFQIYYYIFHH